MKKKLTYIVFVILPFRGKRAFLFPLLLVMMTIPAAAKEKKGQDTSNLPPPKRIIFLSLVDENAGPAYSWVNKSVVDAIEQTMKRKYRFTRVESAKIESAVKELGLSPKDLSKKENVYNIARALNADGVIFGSYRTRALSEEDITLEITGKILSVQQNGIIGEENVRVTVDTTMFGKVEKMGQNLGEKIESLFVPSQWTTFWKSAVYPGWGHEYKKFENRAFWWRIGLISAAGLTGISYGLTLYYKHKYNSYTPEYSITTSGDLYLEDPEGAEAEFDRLESRHLLFKRATYGMVIITGLTYLGTIIDALLLEKNPAEIYTPEYLKKREEEVKLNFDMYRGPGDEPVYSMAFTRRFQ